MNTTMSGTVTVRGIDYEVGFDPEWSQKYSATVNGKRVESTSWKGIQSAIGVEARKGDVTVEVRFMHPNSGAVGTGTKLHASTKRPMVTWDDGDKQQIDLRNPLRPDTDAAQLKRLKKAQVAAQKALDDFLSEHALNGRGDYDGLVGLIQAAQKRVIEERDAAERTVGAVELDVV